METALLEKLRRLGFSLMEVSPEEDFHKTLAEVVESQDPRLWEGFPVLLANASREKSFHYKSVNQYFDHPDHREQYKELLLLSLALYEYLDLKFTWVADWRKHAPKNEVLKVKELRNFMAHHQPLKVWGRRFFADKLKDVFVNYYQNATAQVNALDTRNTALSLEYALSQVFSPKQKELFQKRLAGEKMTKTEREYYSRSVKKKVQALANPELHRLAQRLLE